MTPRPRRQRWLSIPEVLATMASQFPEFYEKLATKTRKRQLEEVRRLVYRAERRDAWRFTKRVSGDIYVNVDALEALLPPETKTVSMLEKNVSDLHRHYRALRRDLSGNLARTRNLEGRMTKAEEKQAEVLRCIQACAAIEARPSRT